MCQHRCGTGYIKRRDILSKSAVMSSQSRLSPVLTYCKSKKKHAVSVRSIWSAVIYWRYCIARLARSLRKSSHVNVKELAVYKGLPRCGINGYAQWIV